MPSKDNGTRRFSLSDQTPVQLGLLLAVIGGVCACIWWAATINSKLDSVLKLQAASDTLASQTRRDLDTLRREFDVHIAATSKAP